VEQHDPVRLIADEQPRLARELHDLPSDVWTAPSRCAGWSNARVVGHLTFYAGVYRQSVTRALNGDTAPQTGPDGQPMTREQFMSLAGDREVALAQEAPGNLVDQFVRSGEELVDVFRRLSPAAHNRGAWHPARVFTIGTLLAFRTYELGFHGWDIRASVDPAAELRPELCPFLVDFVCRFFVPQACHPDANLEGTCRCEVDGQTWTYQVGEGRVAEASPSAVPDAVIRTDPSTYLLLATSRRALANRVDRIVMDGERQRGEQLLGATCYRM
jgi:uncharacterized protein (TIGR03083 family)